MENPTNGVHGGALSQLYTALCDAKTREDQGTLLLARSRWSKPLRATPPRPSEDRAPAGNKPPERIRRASWHLPWAPGPKNAAFHREKWTSMAMFINFMQFRCPGRCPVATSAQRTGAERCRAAGEVAALAAAFRGAGGHCGRGSQGVDFGIALTPRPQQCSDT